MGALTSRISRQLNRFNAENRAHRLIANPQPRPAPKYDTTLKDMEMLKQENPSLEGDLLKFDKDLNERLKQVYVTSTDIVPPTPRAKLPPLSHSVRRTSDYGFDDSDPVSEGRIILKDVIQMLTNYARSDGTSTDISRLAGEYKIAENDAKNIVKYYECFMLRMPKSGYDEQKYLGKFLFGRESGVILNAEEFMEELRLPTAEQLDRKGLEAVKMKNIEGRAVNEEKTLPPQPEDDVKHAILQKRRSLKKK